MSEASTIARSAAGAAEAGLSGDQIIINGASLGLDEIVNPAFLAPKRVNALHEAFIGAKPFPHIFSKISFRRVFSR
jgi:hypothetical protein